MYKLELLLALALGLQESFLLRSLCAANLRDLILHFLTRHLSGVRSNIQEPVYWSQGSIGVGLEELHMRY